MNELLDVWCFIREQKELLIDILLAEQNYEGNIIEKYSPIIDSAKELLALIDKLQLPSFCPIVSELTDAGPGVGVNNNEVKFRFAEICRLHKVWRRTRIHRAREDSGQNEAERTNGSIGDALVDGATIKGDYVAPYDGLSQEDREKMSLEDLEQYKEANMEKNAWMVCEEIKLRVDDEKGPGGDFMRAYVTEHNEDQFFFNKDELLQFCEKAPSQNQVIITSRK